MFPKRKNLNIIKLKLNTEPKTQCIIRHNRKFGPIENIPIIRTKKITIETNLIDISIDPIRCSESTHHFQWRTRLSFDLGKLWRNFLSNRGNGDDDLYMQVWT